jgi:hypothetical protein
MWRGSRQGKLSAGRSCRIPASARKAAILSSPIGTLLENRRNLPAPARSQALCTQTHSRSRHARRARTFSRAFIGSPIVKQHPRKDRNDRHCFSLSGFQSRWENAHETLNLTIASIFVCSDQWLKRRAAALVQEVLPGAAPLRAARPPVRLRQAMNGSTTGNNGPSQGLSPANEPNAGPPSNAAGSGAGGRTHQRPSSVSSTGR